MNAPMLRFNGFKEDWKTVKFKSVFSEVTEKTGDTKNFPLYSLTVQDGVTKKTDRYNREFLVKKENNFKIVRSNYFVSNPMNMTIGALAQYKGSEDISVSGYYNVFKNISSYKNQFLEDYLKSSKMIWLYKSIATGSLIEKQRVHFSQFIELAVRLPDYKEANKISDFMETLTKKILLQQEKINLLKEQKKSYLQKIFSQELRFRDGDRQEYPNWRKSKLKEFLVQYTEKTTYNNQYPPLTSSREGIFLQSNYFKRQVASEDNTGYNIVPNGYFTYRHMSDDATFKFNINDIVENGIVSTLYPVFTTNEKLDKYFLKFFLNESPSFKQYGLLQQQGGSRTYMYFSKLIEFESEFPSIEEQLRIAEFLKVLNNKIQKEILKHDLLVKQKQAFMQQMFI